MSRIFPFCFIGLGLLLVPACNPNNQYLSDVLEIEQWLDHQTLENLEVWPDVTDEPERVTLSLSGGMSGGLIFYLELFNATGDEVYLDRSQSIGTYLLDNLPQATDSLKNRFWAFSPYGRVCGPGFALTELYKATADVQYRKGAEHILGLLDHFADHKEDTISWDLGNDVLGGLAGTGLHLLYSAEQLQSQRALQMAIQSGETLLARASDDGNGLFWKRGQNGRFVLPNFSHGNAGIAYFLTRLYEVTRQERFLKGALSAVAYLDSIAKVDDGTFLVPYGFPDNGWRRSFDIGWAHGPAGVGRLFVKLFQATGDQQWLKKAEACLKGIVSSNPLGKPSGEFGSEPFSPDQRFGLAGVSYFAQEMYRLTDNIEYLRFAEDVLVHIKKSSVVENGRNWPTARFGFMSNPGVVTNFTGYFYGNVGYGLLFLNQYYLSLGRRGSVKFVDDPF